MSNPPAPSKQRGCFFYGCLSVSILAVLVTVCIALGLYFAKKKFDAWVQDYTSTTPDKIEELVYPEPKMKELRARIATFQQAAEKDPKSVELVLTADDLNALIAAEPELKGKVFVRIDDDQVKGQVSVPLPDVGPFKLKGRYLNGSAAFKVVLTAGLLDVRLEHVTVKDKPLPPVILAELKKKNLAEDAQNNPDAVRAINRVETLEVRDGKVFIRSKPGSVPVAQPSPSPQPQP